MFVQGLEGGVGGTGGVEGLAATGVETECTCVLQDLGLCSKHFLLASQPVKLTNDGPILLIGEQNWRWCIRA